MVISWTFVEAIEALRFHLYVVLHGKASSEQLTSTIVLALGAMYFVTLVAFLLVDVCRKSGRCVVKYEQLDHDEQDAVTFSRDPMAPATSSVISVAVPDGPSQQIVVVHCEDEGRVDCWSFWNGSSHAPDQSSYSCFCRSIDFDFGQVFDHGEIEWSSDRLINRSIRIRCFVRLIVWLL